MDDKTGYLGTEPRSPLHNKLRQFEQRMIDLGRDIENIWATIPQALDEELKQCLRDMLDGRIKQVVNLLHAGIVEIKEGIENNGNTLS